MTTEELTMRGAISMLPQEDQVKIFNLADNFIKIVSEEGENGFIAFTLASLRILKDYK
jgi:hypothetical protein